MKVGTYTSARGRKVQVSLHDVPEGDGLQEWVIFVPNELRRYYHPKHPDVEKEFDNAMNDLTLDGKPLQSRLNVPPGA